MHFFKSAYVSLFVVLNFLFLGFSIYDATIFGVDLANIGGMVTPTVVLLYILRLYLLSQGRTSQNLMAELFLVTIGVALAASSFTLGMRWPRPTVFTLLTFGNLVGMVIYTFWYSHLGREESHHLGEGETLPDLTFTNADHKEVKLSDIEAKFKLFMFYRGNWCPLCMAQIKEIAHEYRELADMGVQVILISPQSHENTEVLSRRFEVPFLFLVDEENKAAEELGIAHKNGLPLGLQLLGYDSDTVFPTVVITDANNKVIYAHQTDNYRVRPEPSEYLRIVKQIDHAA